jgi:tetratricopeptide (TPR) repeat protein
MSNRKTAIQTTSIVLLSILATANIPARAISPDDAPSLTTKSSHIAQNNPKTADDFYAMGIFKEIQQDYQGALADYDKAIELNPKYDAIYISRADLKKKHFKDYQGALADLNKAVEFVPDFAAGYLNRAVLKIDPFKDIQGAIGDLRQAAKLARAQNRTTLLEKTLAILQALKVSE